MKNDIQRNFKNEMMEAEIKLHEDAEKKKTGVFTNKLFELRFYGYNSEYNKPSKSLGIILFILVLIAILFIIISFIFLFLIVKKG